MRAAVCCMGGVLRRTPGPPFLPLQPVAPFLPLPTPRLSSPSAWFSWAGVPVPGCHPVVFAPGVSIDQARFLSYWEPGVPGQISGRPVRPGFVLGSRLDVPSPGRLRRGCPLFLSSPHSGSPPGFVRRLRLAPDAAVRGVEIPWVPCSRPAVVLLASCPWSDLDSRPEEPWASGIPPRLQFRVRGAHLPRGRLWPVPVRRASGKPGCLHRCVRSL